MTLTGYQLKPRDFGARPISHQQSWILRCARAYDRETADVEEYNRQRAAGLVD